MKKTLTLLTLLAVTLVSLSAHAACGSNTGRNSSTRAPGSPSTTTREGTGAIGGAGFPR